MLRGTVWMIVEGVPVRREVLSVDVDSEVMFKVAADERINGTLSKGRNATSYPLEFGPIGAPWF